MQKRWLRIITVLIIIGISTMAAKAQCSICTKTAQQLGEGPAKSLNTGILYLMFAPLAIMGYIGFTWWKREKEVLASEAPKTESL
jgi:TRAP-type C4-dicarboxylate transport system permease small subunit